MIDNVHNHDHDDHRSHGESEVDAAPRKPLTPAAERALAEAAARAAAADAEHQSRPKELQGPKGPEPTRYGDWETKGIASDFDPLAGLRAWSVRGLVVDLNCSGISAMRTDEQVYPPHWCRKVTSWNVFIQENYAKGDQTHSYSSSHNVKGTLTGSPTKEPQDIDTVCDGVVAGSVSEDTDDNTTIPMKTQATGEQTFQATLSLSGDDENVDYKLVIGGAIGPDVQMVTKELNRDTENRSSTSIPWLVAADIAGRLPRQMGSVKGHADEPPSSGPDDNATGALNWRLEPVTSEDDTDDAAPVQLAKVTKVSKQGTRLVQRAGGEIYTPVWVGMPIYRGDIIWAWKDGVVDYIDWRGQRGQITLGGRTFGIPAGPAPKVPPAVMGGRG